jgi:hypothetical protein
MRGITGKGDSLIKENKKKVLMGEYNLSANRE